MAIIPKHFSTSYLHFFCSFNLFLDNTFKRTLPGFAVVSSGLKLNFLVVGPDPLASHVRSSKKTLTRFGEEQKR